MITKVVERSSGKVLATEKTCRLAFAKAIRRGATPDDLEYVFGEPDIQLHTFACRWAHAFLGLANWYRQKWGKEDIADEKLSFSRRWEAIAKSRQVLNDGCCALPLAELVGETLNLEIEALMRMGQKNDADTFGPDTSEFWKLAYQRAGILAKSNRKKRTFVVAQHRFLGLIVAAPADDISGFPGFVVKKKFSGVAAL